MKVTGYDEYYICILHAKGLVIMAYFSPDHLITSVNVECLRNITVCGNMNHDICNIKNL